MTITSVKFDFAVFDSLWIDRERLRKDWTSVLRQLDDPAYYHYFEWYDSYVKTMEPEPASVFIVIAYGNGQPVGVFPLRRTRDRIAGVPVRLLEIPHSPITLLGDFVFRICPKNSTIVRQLLEFLRRQRELPWDVARISNTLEGSAALCALRSDRLTRACEDDEPGCHYVLCSEFRLSRKLKNKRNRLARLGNIEVVHICDPRSMAAAVDEFMNVEASGWKGSEGTAIRCRPREVAFYHDVAARFAETGAAQVSLLRVCGRCIAGFYMLRTGRTLYWLKHGFDEEFAKSSPGQLLFTEVVQNCLDRGDVDRINFITNNDWHKIFAPRELTKWTTLVFRGNPLGLVSYVGLRSKNLLRQLGIAKFLKRSRADATRVLAEAALHGDSARDINSSDDSSSGRELLSVI